MKNSIWGMSACMKKGICSLVLSGIIYLVSITHASAQSGAAINTTGAAPHPSAILDVSSQDQGMRIPVMSTEQRDSIAIKCACTPAIGLQIFNSDCENFNVYTSNGWVAVNSFAASVSVVATPAGPVCAGTAVTYTAIPVNGGTSPSFQWKRNGTDISGEESSTYVSTSPVNGDVITCELTSNYPCVTGSPATSNSITETVNTPATASISYSGSPFCSTVGGTKTVTLTGTSGGTFSASPSGLSINSSTGAIDVSASSVGSYTVTYTLPASGGCPLFTTTASVAVSSYSGGSQTFNYSGSIASFTVPCATSITIHAYGAQGGNEGGGYTGGRGAYLYGTFSVTPGDVLNLIVGQQPGAGSFYNAGGGGGSFVWNTSAGNALLIAAAGGGGSANQSNGGHGEISSTPSSSSGGAGGTSGGGGGGGNAGSNWAGGGGGAGWLGNGIGGGTNGIYTGAGGGMGALIGNGAGGVAGYNGVTGGFGGGGGGAHASAGGGGGYNGGGGGTAGRGGGGGSYIYGTVNGTSGYQTGHGQIVITW